MMLMGFPALVHAQYPGLCACHGKMRSQGYECPRCKSRLCDVPTECRVCNLTVVSSPHLARSYRHLFPVDNFEVVLEVENEGAERDCASCSLAFPTTVAPVPRAPTVAPAATGTAVGGQGHLSPVGRYRCKECKKDYCLDCDVLIHTALGFCPGCV